MNTKFAIYETSILSEFDLLNDIITSTDKYRSNNQLVNALKNQSSLARYVNCDLKIISMSLNSHKHYCNLVLLDGYSSLNKLRIRSLEVLNFQEREKNAKSQKKNFEILELKLDKLMKHNLILTKIIYDLKYSLEGLSIKSDDPKFKAEVKFKLSSLEKLLIYSSESFNE